METPPFGKLVSFLGMLIQMVSRFDESSLHVTFFGARARLKQRQNPSDLEAKPTQSCLKLSAKIDYRSASNGLNVGNPAGCSEPARSHIRSADADK